MSCDFDGRKYGLASPHQREWGCKLIADIHLEGRERVLDLGCGDGSLTARIAGLLPHGEVIGIDSSKGMLEAARGRENRNLRFILRDINDLDFDCEFDLVFSNAALHWIKDHGRLLENVRRALKPDGRVRFNFAGEGNCSNFCIVVREAMSLHEFSSCFSGFEWPWHMPSVEAYGELAKASGLRETRVWGESADRCFQDEDEMARWIDQPSIVPFLARLPECAREAFRAFVVKGMLERTKQANGGCFETFRRINLAASR